MGYQIDWVATKDLVTAMVALFSVGVAVYTTFVTLAKYRLDLYNKRWAVFVASLEVYQQSISPKLDEIDRVSSAFILAQRESQFLFDKRDRIFEILEEVRGDFFDCKAYYYEHRRLDEINFGESMDGALIHTLSRKVDEARPRIQKNIYLLETKLQKYLNYRIVRPWGLGK